MMKRRIKSVEQLCKLAQQKKAVWIPNGRFSKRHMPAAWMVNMNAYYLVSLIGQGMYVYGHEK